MGIKIKMGIDNAGQCDALFRSGRIEPEQYGRLHLLQIKTVVNLEAEYDDKRVVQAAGFSYVYLPLKDKTRPPDDFAEKFLAVIADTGDAPFWTHCKGGRHRTGAAIAVYRIAKCGWTFDDAWKEAKQFGYYRWFGHGGFEDYVRDFAKMRV
jgi:protein tyrosine/serine phosphatase